MTVEEMDNMFDVLYNNITSNQALGLNAYEKSVFLTKAQDEIIKNYFNSKSKGNNIQEGFDANQKRQIDFSMLTTVVNIVESSNKDRYTKVTDMEDKYGNDVYKIEGTNTSLLSEPYTVAYDSFGPMKDSRGDQLYIKGVSFDTSLFDSRDNTKSISLPPMLMAINEIATVSRGDTNTTLQVIPIRFDEYSRLMSKPYKRPLKYQAWRLINNNIKNKADIVIGPGDTLIKYTIRYIRRPLPIIVGYLDELTIEGIGVATECELDPILHEEILQRAIELAKTAWLSNDANSMQLQTAAGLRSE